MRSALGLALIGVIATGTCAVGQTRPAAAHHAGGTTDASDHLAAPDDRSVRAEPAVAVSPLDPRRVVTAAVTVDNGNDIYIGVNTSHDGGHTFLANRMRNLPDGVISSDPNLAFDGRGRLFALYLSYDGRRPGAGGLAINRSDDGGDTWAREPVVVSHNTRRAGRCTFEDFPALAADPRPTSKAVHVAWQRATFSGADCSTYVTTTVMTSSSADSGLTWSPARPLPLARGGRGYIPTITVGPDGTVVVTVAHIDDATALPDAVAAWVAACPSDAFPRTSSVSLSRDGGRSYRTSTAQTFCAPGTDVSGADPVTHDQLSSYTGATYRLLPNTNTVVDPRTGILVNVASGQDPVTGQQHALTAWSRDGRHWTSGGPVPSTPDENQQFPRLAVAPSGRLSLVYLSQLPGGVLQATHTVSADDARSWSPAMTLSSTPSRILAPFWLGFIGDYIGNAVGSDGVAHPVWTDPRPRGSSPQDDVRNGPRIYTRAVAT